MDAPRQPAPPSAAFLRDQDLVALLAAGERDGAFEALARRYESKVYRLCLTLLRDRHAAEDAAQEALLRVWRALPRFDPGAASLSTWIYTITRNHCLNALRDRPAEQALDDEGLAALAEVASAPTPQQDLIAVLRRQVEALPEAQRRAVLLYYYEERSVADSALMLGMPEGTLKTHLHRGRAALRERLQALGLGDPSDWLQGELS